MMLNSGQMSPEGRWLDKVGENTCTFPVWFVEKYQVEFLSRRCNQPTFVDLHIPIFKIWM
jgi:hypothetical protein